MVDGVKYMDAEKKEESEILRVENLAARSHYDLDSTGARKLMAAMCLGAVQDWLKANQKLEAARSGLSRYRGSYLKGQIAEMEQMKKDCEEFFDSDIFAYMTGLDREDTIRKISNLPARMIIANIEKGLKH